MRASRAIHYTGKEPKMGMYEEKVLARLDEVGAWAREGYTEEDIAKELGVSYSGFLNYKKQHIELTGVLTENKKIADNAVRAALFKRATGYSYTKEKKTRNEEGRLVVTEKETVEVAADVSAAKFWLTNREPENWKDRQTKDIHAHVDANIEEFL